MPIAAKRTASQAGIAEPQLPPQQSTPAAALDDPVVGGGHAVPPVAPAPALPPAPSPDVLNASQGDSKKRRVKRPEWDEMFEAVKLYQAQNGKLPVKEATLKKDDGTVENVGRWCHRQRTQYKKGDHGSLSAEKINKLESIGFRWNRRRDEWERMFDAVQKWRDEHGRLPPPRKTAPRGDGSGEIDNVGNWCSTQRMQYNKPDHGRLGEEKIKKLESIGFKWKPHAAEWDRMLAVVLDWKEKNGRFPPYKEQVPRDDGSGAVDHIGLWCNTQRTQYNKTNHGALTEERIRRLQEVGFSWSPGGDEWERMYNLVAEWKAAHDGKFPAQKEQVNRGNEIDRIGYWFNSQRTQFKKEKHGRLNDYRVQKLKELGL